MLIVECAEELMSECVYYGMREEWYYTDWMLVIFPLT